MLHKPQKWKDKAVAPDRYERPESHSAEQTGRRAGIMPDQNLTHRPYCLVYGSACITQKRVRISLSDCCCLTNWDVWEFRFRAAIVCGGFGVKRPIFIPYFIVLLASHSISLIHRNLTNKIEIVSMPLDSRENLLFVDAAYVFTVITDIGFLLDSRASVPPSGLRPALIL